VTKPFNLRELILRFRALLWRWRPKTKIEVLEVGAFQVDKNKFEIQLEGRRLDLTTTRILALVRQEAAVIGERATAWGKRTDGSSGIPSDSRPEGAGHW
jgi:DNA-binding response OmpR family regulator